MILADPPPRNLVGVLVIVEANKLPPTRRRDMISAIKRICTMAGVAAAAVNAEPAELRSLVAGIRPALHGVGNKTWANLRSSFVAALELTGVVDPMGRGGALAHSAWGPLMASIKSDRRMFCGLAAFANWCVGRNILPEAVNDAAVAEFLVWLEARTLSPKPQDVARRIPNIWNEARARVPGWPPVALTSVSFRPPPKRVLWKDLPDSFRRDAEAYLSMRAKPDLFDDRPGAPRRPLAPATVKLQREQLHSAASVLIEEGMALEAIASLSDLVAVESFKTILRHFHNKAGCRANAFLHSLARTLIQVAKYHVGMAADDVGRLSRVAAKLPAVPFDLTAKNKALISQLESERLRANLIFLPDKLANAVTEDLKCGRVRFVWAQVAVAIDILLAAPLRAQNLCPLHWARHFSEPDGSKGRLILHIPAPETKTGKNDYVAELPPEVAQRLRWYKARIMPLLGADPNGFLFVTKGGGLKTQETLSQQIVEAIADHVGIHMTPHQFRHFAATLYLEERPEDFETARSLLGHGWSKTTSIYAGSSSRRASRAYGKALFEQREALKLAGKRKRMRRPTSSKAG
jgi:hypothetical protein